MKLPSLLLLALPILLSDVSACRGVPPEEASPAVAAARRDVQQAKSHLAHFQDVERPRARRKLDGAIEVVEAEIEALRAQLAQYEEIAAGTIPSPLMLTIQETRLGLLSAELRLAELIDDRIALDRSHRASIRQLVVEVQAAESRLLRLLGKR